jgi:hypothetical protein
MPIQDRLADRRAERDALFARVAALLRADSRIVATWLTGSLGRGDGDDLSDLDFWIVVRDDAMAAVAAERQSIVARAGSPVLIQEAPHNAPVGGAFLLVFYESVSGLQEIDWHWQPQSHARRPRHVRLVFDHVGIPDVEPAPLYAKSDQGALLTERIVFFWAMAPIAARKIARRQPQAALRLIDMMKRASEEVRWACSLRDTAPLPEERGRAIPPVLPGEQLAALRTLTRETEALTDTILAHGGTVPVEAIPHVYTFYDFTESLLAENHVPGSGRVSSQS